MVNCVERGERTREIVMAMGVPERRSNSSKPPLHNFDLPCLKWGNQRQLRCMKISNASPASTDRLRRIGRSKNDCDVRQFKKQKRRNDSFETVEERDEEEEEEEGIDEMREKLMFDFKTAAYKMKDEIFSKGNDEGDDVMEQSPPLRPPSVAAPPASAAIERQELRPWNLRTRRAACKAPAGKSFKIEEKKLTTYNSNNINSTSNYNNPNSVSKSPRLREKEEEAEHRPKFSVALSKKETEDDFMALLGHRPARRPKKRPRFIQKQLDSLFPGLWLSEITVDTYKVPELPDNGKR